jgi:hypothetical protein
MPRGATRGFIPPASRLGSSSHQRAKLAKSGGQPARSPPSGGRSALRAGGAGAAAALRPAPRPARPSAQPALRLVAIGEVDPGIAPPVLRGGDALGEGGAGRPVMRRGGLDLPPGRYQAPDPCPTSRQNPPR